MNTSPGTSAERETTSRPPVPEKGNEAAGAKVKTPEAIVDPIGADALSLFKTEVTHAADIIPVLGDDTAFQDLKSDGKSSPQTEIDPNAKVAEDWKIVKRLGGKVSQMTGDDLRGIAAQLDGMTLNQQIFALKKVDGIKDAKLKVTSSNGTTREIPLDDPYPKKIYDGDPYGDLQDAIGEEGAQFNPSEIAAAVSNKLEDMANRKDGVKKKHYKAKPVDADDNPQDKKNALADSPAIATDHSRTATPEPPTVTAQEPAFKPANKTIDTPPARTRSEPATSVASEPGTGLFKKMFGRFSRTTPTAVMHASEIRAASPAEPAPELDTEQIRAEKIEFTEDDADNLLKSFDKDDVPTSTRTDIIVHKLSRPDWTQEARNRLITDGETAVADAKGYAERQIKDLDEFFENATLPEAISDHKKARDYQQRTIDNAQLFENIRDHPDIDESIRLKANEDAGGDEAKFRQSYRDQWKKQQDDWEKSKDASASAGSTTIAEQPAESVRPTAPALEISSDDPRLAPKIEALKKHGFEGTQAVEIAKNQIREEENLRKNEEQSHAVPDSATGVRTEPAPSAGNEAKEPPKAPEAKEPLTPEQQALVDAGKIGAELGKIGLDDESFKKAADALLTQADNPQALQNIRKNLEALRTDPEAAKAFATKLAKEGAGSAADATEASATGSTPEADSAPKSPEQIKKEEQIKTMAEIGRTIANENEDKQNEILDHIARNPDTTQESLKLLKTIKSGDNEAVAAIRQDYEDRLKALEDKINDPEKTEQAEEQKKEAGWLKALLALIGIAAIGLASATGELSRAK